MGNDWRITSYVEWIIKWRWMVLLVTVVAVLGAGSGARFLGFNNDYHVFFDKGNPQVEAFDGLQDKYTKDDNVYVVIQPENGKVFTKETLKAIAALEEEAWLTPFSSRVDALSNYQHTRSVGDDMYVEDLYSDIDNKSDKDLEKIKAIAMGEKLLRNRLINDDASITAVNVTVNLPVDSMQGSMIVANHVRELVKEWEVKYPGHKTYLSGTIMLNMAFSEGAMWDMGHLVPLMFLIILAMVGFTTRSISGTFTAFLVLLFSIMAAMGLAGWAGVELTGPSSSAPTMIMTLAIADSIHLLVTMFLLMRRGTDKISAIKESVKINFMPVFLTSVTTIIGFLTLNFAEGAPFHDLGNITAAGVAVAFLLSVGFLPALMAVLPVKVKFKSEEEVENGMLMRLANYVIANNRKLLIGSSLAVILISAMAVTNELNNEFVKFFDKSVKFRTDTDFIADNISGVYNLEFSLGAGEDDAIANPEYLQKLDEFEAWFLEQPEVVHVNAFSEIMKRVNKSMHGDSLDFYAIPNTRAEAAQFLLLYEMSLPYGLDLNNQINVNKSETRFTVTTENISSNDMMALSLKAEEWLKSHAPEHMFSYGISTALMFSHITKNNMDSMLKGGIGALILISFILMFALRSAKYGMISLVPNVTPIAVAFGLWAIFNGQVNMALTVVLGMTLGIVVDDTVHLLSKYIRARREYGKSPEDAIRYAFTTVGKAVVVTTIVLVAGFSVLMQSSFGLNSGMGKLTAITIVVALILDMILLPALLLTIDKGSDLIGTSKPKELEVTEAVDA